MLDSRTFREDKVQLFFFNILFLLAKPCHYDFTNSSYFFCQHHYILTGVLGFGDVFKFIKTDQIVYFISVDFT